MLLVALTPLVLQVFKLLVPSIPKVFLPLLAPVVGVLLDLVMKKAGMASDGTVAAAVFGGLGTWLREVLDQSRKVTTDGLVTAGGASKLLIFGLGASLLIGCAHSNQTITSQEMSTNGTILTSTTKSRVGTVFQSSQTIEKVRASNGKTQSIGASGMDQKSEASVFVDAMGKSMEAMAGLALKAYTAQAGLPAPNITPIYVTPSNALQIVTPGSNYIAPNPAQVRAVAAKAGTPSEPIIVTTNGVTWIVTNGTAPILEVKPDGTIGCKNCFGWNPAGWVSTNLSGANPFSGP